jgi:TolA-binding protein
MAGEYRTATVFVKEKKYNEAIAIYHKIMAESPETQLSADAQYQIALVHALSDNPERNCATAIQEFEEFLKLHPADSRTLEAQNWIATLKINLELKKQYESLRKDNDLLRKNIEELKRLDIRHEERRKGK